MSGLPVICRICLALAVCVVGTAARGQGLPQPFTEARVFGSPTAADTIRAQAILEPCYVVSPIGSQSISVDGNVVTWAINVRSITCGPPLPQDGTEISFGPLPAGAYTLLVRAREPLGGELGPPFVVPFTVNTISVPALHWIGVLLLGSVLLAAGWVTRRRMSVRR